LEQLGPDRESPGTLRIRILEPKVGQVQVVTSNGQPLRTRRDVLEKILHIPPPGSPLNERQFRRDIEQLFATRWFDTMNPTATAGADPGVVDITLEVTEVPTGLFNAGIALDPQSRLVGQLSYSDYHFRGSGQSVGVVLSQATAGGGPSVDLAYGNQFLDRRGSTIDAKVYSRVVYNFTGSGTNPFGGGGSQVGNSSAFDERRTGLDFTYGRPLRENILGTIGLKAENIRSLNLTQGNNNNGTSVQQDGDLAILKLGASWDTAFPRLDPFTGRTMTVFLEPGYSNITKVGGTVGGLGSVGKNTFLRGSLEYRQYWSPSKATDDDLNAPIDTVRPVLAFRARYGHISGRVPFFEQLFVGGSGSLRGYDNQQFWGSDSFLATVEYRKPIQRNFSLIGFADYGGAWGGYGQLTGFPQSNHPDLRLAYGMGVGFTVPQFGQIRLDYAFNQNGGTKLHFTIGSSF
jgi:outer membrane protein insertion porin family